MKAGYRALLAYVAGQCYAFVRMNERAIGAYRRCVGLQPEHAQAWRMIGFYTQQDGRDQEAIEAFTRALAVEPDDAATRYNLGYLQHRGGELASALGQMREAIRLRPSLDQAWYGGGLILSELGEHAESVVLLEEAARLQPFHGAASFALCKAYQATGEDARLIAEYRRIRQFDPPTAQRLRDELGLPP